MVAVKTGTRNAVSREVFEGIAAGFSLAGEWCLLMILLSGRSAGSFQSGRFFRIVIFLTVMTLGLYRGMEIWLLPVSAAAEWFSYDVLVKMGGFLTGLLLAGLGGYLTFEAARALTYRRLLFVLAVQTAALSFQQIIFLIQILMARQLLPGGTLIRAMAPFIDHQSWFIFAVFFITLLVPVTLFLQKNRLVRMELIRLNTEKFSVMPFIKTVGNGFRAVSGGYGRRIQLWKCLCQSEGAACSRGSGNSRGR